MNSSPEQPQAILLVPTSMGAGLTSACLGLIQALDTIGLKAGFLKPFMQNELNGPGLDRSTALVSRTLRDNDLRAKLRANDDATALHAVLSAAQGIKAA